MALNWSRLRTYSIRRRRSLVDRESFAGTPGPRATVAELLRSLPDVYAARSLRALIQAVAQARRRKRPVVVALGGHVIKVGVGPLLQDLVARGFVTALALNGGAAIHDYEISLTGRTSEDVAAALKDGSFGMARETARAFARAARRGAHGLGLGRALGELILADKNPHRRLSLLATAARRDIPATVHVALGTDITHMHPDVRGRDLGESSLHDFRALTEVVADLEGGVWINLGSAVVLPEVFLKALTVARNLGRRVRRFTAANLDMIQHYRPGVNVLARPGGTPIAITGHHEILVPLLRAGILAVASGARIQ